MWRMQVEQLDGVANIDNLLATAANEAGLEIRDLSVPDTVVVTKTCH